MAEADDFIFTASLYSTPKHCSLILMLTLSYCWVTMPLQSSSSQHSVKFPACKECFIRQDIKHYYQTLITKYCFISCQNWHDSIRGTFHDPSSEADTADKIGRKYFAKHLPGRVWGRVGLRAEKGRGPGNNIFLVGLGLFTKCLQLWLICSNHQIITSNLIEVMNMEIIK